MVRKICTNSLAQNMYEFSCLSTFSVVKRMMNSTCALCHLFRTQLPAKDVRLPGQSSGAQIDQEHSNIKEGSEIGGGEEDEGTEGKIST